LDEKTPFRIEQLRLETGERYVLTVGSDGMPVWWPNLFCTVCILLPGRGYSTMQAKMAAIRDFHNLCGRLGIDIDARIESLELFPEAEIVALREELRPRNSEARGSGSADVRGKAGKNGHWKSRLIAVRDYIVWRANQVIDRLPLRDPGLPEARRRIEALPKRLVGGLKVHSNTSEEGMDEKTERAFLDAITPGHPTNPFRKRNQYRNQALWLLYYAGLRRSAPLVLTGRHLHLNDDKPYVFVPRTQDDPEDPREEEPRNKTLAHDVSLTPETAATLHRFVVHHRPTYPNARKSKFVFFSQEGKPLSIGSVVFMYKQLRAKVPGLAKDFTTHMVRRTNKDRMGDAAEELGWDSDVEESVTNQQSGWTRSSKTRLTYQRRRLRQKANDLSLKMQDIATKGRADG